VHRERYLAAERLYVLADQSASDRINGSCDEFCST
jgi:hypothetical protein